MSQPSSPVALLAAAVIAAAAPMAWAAPDGPTFISRADGVMLMADGVVGASVYLPNPQKSTTQRFQGDDWSEHAGDSLGTVSDVVVDATGRIVALVVEIGGFFGLGARPVAISFGVVSLAPGPEGEQDVRVIVDVTHQDLENAPRFDADAVRHPHLGARERQAWLTRLARDGFEPVELDAVPTQALAAARVFDIEDAPVGQVTGLLFDGEGAVDRAVIAVEEGGWMGSETRSIALPLDRVSAFRSDTEVRLYTEGTRADLETVPDHAE